ncbi:hypothetical protein FHL15_002503 [Xylaria flabelliformis]|uniref:Uncharacterized protein n=1 Tax=Xylaria flabelliformis TaxID=2512241 RepID=A0A553I8T9_9PEZI|nr:hypothetical protein FHL15_002503 [Xylaria flabelliformis]
MCTGIVHVFRCQQCNAVVCTLKEAAQGYTCYQARSNRGRGICGTGIDYAHYDRVSDDDCLFCEIYLSGEISNLTAEICSEAEEPWQEDIEDGLELAPTEYCYVEEGDMSPNRMNKAEHEDAGIIEQLWKEEDVDNDDDNDDEEEGGAMLY